MTAALYRDLFDKAPDMMALIDLGSGKVFECNQTLADGLGISKDEILGRSFLKLYRAASWTDAKRTFKDFRRTGRVINAERVLRRTDGIAMHVLLQARPIRDQTGKIVAAHAIWRDITARKRTQEELAESRLALEKSHRELKALTARLLKSQEEERRRIARDLHDEISQRLSMTTVEATRLAEDLTLSGGQIPARLKWIESQLARLTDDVGNLAHRLHPSTLEHLGLRAAIQAHIQELKLQEGFQVDFKERSLPDSLPLDIASCVFRVMQEGLRNVVKHARVKRAEVRLEARDHSLKLSIKDKGIGFDLDSAGHEGKLGLISMRERVQLAKGSFSVKENRGGGARILVSIPLHGR